MWQNKTTIVHEKRQKKTSPSSKTIVTPAGSLPISVLYVYYRQKIIMLDLWLEKYYDKN